jgi:hypothetical protein
LSGSIAIASLRVRPPHRPYRAPGRDRRGGFSMTPGDFRRDTDSLLEGDGFEPSVPHEKQPFFGCPRSVPAIRLRQQKPALSCQGPMVRIHLPPAETTNFRFREMALRRNGIRWKIGGTLPVARLDDVSRQGIEVTIHNPIGERVDCSTAEMANLEIGSIWRGTFIR